MAAPAFRPARPRRALDEIIEQIRARVRSGDLRPGDRLPSEREMAEQFSVGRNSVREALRMLEIIGLIELRRGATGGAFIAHADPAKIATTMSDMLEFSGFTLADLTEARRWVEETVVGVACERADEALLARLEANIAQAERLARSDDAAIETRATVNLEFHTILATATGNPVMIALMHSLMGVMLTLVLDGGEPMDPDTVISSRRRVLDAMRRRDSRAAVDEMNDHLIRVWKWSDAAQR